MLPFSGRRKPHFSESGPECWCCEVLSRVAGVDGVYLEDMADGSEEEEDEEDEAAAAELERERERARELPVNEV